MGRASYVLAGEPGAMVETFGSACHGAGRLLSRHEALRRTKGRSIERELQDNNVYPQVGREKDSARGVPRSLQGREHGRGRGSQSRFSQEGG